MLHVLIQRLDFLEEVHGTNNHELLLSFSESNVDLNDLLLLGTGFTVVSDRDDYGVALKPLDVVDGTDF